MYLIVAGTYERFLYGLSGGNKTQEEGALDTPLDEKEAICPELNPEFMYPAHISCIKAIAASHRYLATGSTDEHVKLYDLKTRKEIGTLMHHSGAITSLEFYNKTHLLTGSEDGTIGIVRVHDWQVLTALKGHKDGVTAMSVHPSGKVLLTTSKDKTMKCWDLTKARCTHTTKLKSLKGGVAQQIQWCYEGENETSSSGYAILFEEKIEIHDVASASQVGTISSPRVRLNCMAYVSVSGEKYVIAGLENGHIQIYGEQGGEALLSWDSKHGNRVKSMTVFEDEGSMLLATCSSNGSIFVWNLSSSISSLSKGDSQSPAPISKYDTKSRLVCISHSPFFSAVEKKLPVEIDEGVQSESEFEDLLSTVKPKVTVKFENDDDGGREKSKKNKPAYQAIQRSAGGVSKKKKKQDFAKRKLQKSTS